MSIAENVDKVITRVQIRLLLAEYISFLMSPTKPTQLYINDMILEGEFEEGMVGVGHIDKTKVHVIHFSLNPYETYYEFHTGLRSVYKSRLEENCYYIANSQI